MATGDFISTASVGGKSEETLSRQGLESRDIEERHDSVERGGCGGSQIIRSGLAQKDERKNKVLTPLNGRRLPRGSGKLRTARCTNRFWSVEIKKDTFGGSHTHVLSLTPEDSNAFYVLTRKPRRIISYKRPLLSSQS